jgi:hypothetical protein
MLSVFVEVDTRYQKQREGKDKQQWFSASRAVTYLVSQVLVSVQS